MTSESYRDCASKNTVTSHQLPIPPASEPMQYRAIGLIQGTYVPSEEQFTRGTLMTEDNQPIDAVLLGRVMSLVKKHVDLTIPHLWVVYPRTRPKNEHLHAQIVGIWEPDKLHRVFSDDAEAEQDERDDSNGANEATSEPGTSEAMGTDTENVADAPAEITDSEASDQSEDSGTADSLNLSDSETPDAGISGSAAASSTEASSTEASSTEAGIPPQEESDRLATDTETAPSLDDAGATDGPQLVKPSRPKFSAAAAQAANSSGTAAAEPPAAAPAIAPSSQPPTTTPPAQPILKDGYFSVRGEVIQFSPEDDQITIRIRQANRKGGGTSSDSKIKVDSQEKEFKLHLQGRLDGRVVGYFWDLQVQRQGNDLVVFDSNMIGVVPPRKNRSKKGAGGPFKGGRGGAKRRFDGGRPTRSGDRPSTLAHRSPGS
ncbi:MAG: hypothetical protein VKJ64_11605, partial [Leptolyngbyaceae bacterium]|nr:hypothetical protein [Leptolyngbyaceae bacterium]